MSRVRQDSARSHELEARSHELESSTLLRPPGGTPRYYVTLTIQLTDDTARPGGANGERWALPSPSYQPVPTLPSQGRKP